jgi:hypothetical protein
MAGTGDDCELSPAEVMEVEEALAPGSTHPVRRRLVGMIEAYRPAARAALEDLGYWVKEEKRSRRTT